MDERSRKREDDWFLQNEKKLLEDVKKAREKRDAERRAKETEEERAKLKQLHWMKCPKCGHESHIFGSGGAERMCKDYGTELLGQLPLDESIREQADSGKPTVVADPDGKAAEIYRRIARRCAVKIAESQRDMTSKFPNIVVQNT